MPGPSSKTRDRSGGGQRRGSEENITGRVLDQSMVDNAASAGVETALFL